MATTTAMHTLRPVRLRGRQLQRKVMAMKRNASRIGITITADLRPGHRLTQEDIYQAVVETMTAWVAEERHWRMTPNELPMEGHHTLLESRSLLSNPDRYKNYPAALDEAQWRREARDELAGQR